MKKGIVGMVVAAAAILTLGSATTASADTLEAIQEQQEQKHQEISSLQKEVNTVLEDVSELSLKLADLDEDISEKEAEIVQTEEEVAAQEEVVAARMEQARTRLQSLQLNETNQNMLLTIMEAESLSDFFNRAMVVIRLTDAGNQQLAQAEEDVQHLVDLQDQLKDSQQVLKESLAEAEAQKEVFDEKVTSLQALIRENESELTALVEKEAAEVARIEAARRAAREAADRAAAEKATEQRAAARATAEETTGSNESSTSSSSSSSASRPSTNQTASASASSNSTASSQPSQPASKPAQSESSGNQSSGRSMRVQATGYSTRQPNLSTHTATGIDLRVNPRVIAVDPSIIPLGTMVEVEGMGVYIAGDTGGAIRGNIIDIHFETVSQALQWGRRNVNIRILN